MTFALREAHAFVAAGQQFLYLVPSAAVFALDRCSIAVIDQLRGGAREADVIVRELGPTFAASEVAGTIAELRRVRAIAETTTPAPMPKIVPLKPVPLQTLVVNVTNQCQVPDQLNHAPDWTAKCAAAQKDWRKIDLIFPDKK